ncbi:MAG: cytochrome c biogenesis protein CcsA [Burkholderiales bacterium]|nr:cytochrome c biogenesis protein CcsA [Burkholderiales bacterium]
MILSTASPTLAPGGVLLLVVVALALYGLAALPWLRRFSAAALVGGWMLHGVLLLIDIAGVGMHEPGARLGFAPVLSLTVWLVIAVYSVENQFVPLPAVRQWLALAGGVVILLGALFPGEMRPISSQWIELHFALGVGAYALFGAAVVHALLLDGAERRLRAAPRPGPRPPPAQALGMPLLQLERLTFAFVLAGFCVLTAAIGLGIATTVQWRWADHKVAFSFMAWFVFAALLLGRRLRGWRGRHATRWLYIGAVLLLLGYAGSRFVFEVLLGRPAP